MQFLKYSALLLVQFRQQPPSSQTRQVCKPTTSKISDFEINGITFEVGGKNKKGQQIKEAQSGYLVKDDLEYASGHSIPIWMFGFLY